MVWRELWLPVQLPLQFTVFPVESSRIPSGGVSKPACYPLLFPSKPTRQDNKTWQKRFVRQKKKTCTSRSLSSIWVIPATNGSWTASTITPFWAIFFVVCKSFPCLLAVKDTKDGRSHHHRRVPGRFPAECACATVGAARSFRISGVPAARRGQRWHRANGPGAGAWRCGPSCQRCPGNLQWGKPLGNLTCSDESRRRPQSSWCVAQGARVGSEQPHGHHLVARRWIAADPWRNRPTACGGC